ncbi:DUF4351 domain-containing protein [Spirulina sp. 06S082]|uniref:DUF4351 domain-containing protein n=1 Tax=Spirulina sp. 06S082 TaxID=3110248 RepID=UPI002B207FFC|nr:DUF4351 domain-containing protein [Spirulina sp. 06S082]MEA5468709.1 DUF4351 domain-containing protein [Spirulina sp. 06S082]
MKTRLQVNQQTIILHNIQEKIANLSLLQLEKLTDAQFDFATLEDLLQWLEKENSTTNE